MKNTEIEKIIIKYLNNRATKKDIEVLKQTINNEKHKSLFENYVQSNHILDLEFKIYNSKQALAKFNEKTDNKSNFKISWYNKPLNILKYAAIIAIVATSAILMINNNTEIKGLEKQITLELNDGTIQIINLDKKRNIIDTKGIVLGRQDNNKLVYQNSTLNSEESKLVYNTLYVPHGKRFQIELSDGTLVHLNSGTSLKYPVQFIKGLSREVFINDGEAYFEVSKDKNHPFIVNCNNISTKVYGTEFNISSYHTDKTQSVVLVEGSVGIYNNTMDINKEEEILLSPNEKASFNKSDKQFSIKTVNVANYIAWKDGVLWFKNEPFENIIYKLERHYDVSIQNNYAALNQIKFTGTFDIETIGQVLEAFQSYRPFNYNITDNKQIIINK